MTQDAPANGGDRLTVRKIELIEAAAADPRLVALDVRVLVIATSFVHRRRDRDFGLAWPSIQTIADIASTTRRSVMRAMKKLVAGGYLETVRKGGGRSTDGTGISNVFRLGKGDTGVTVNCDMGVTVGGDEGCQIEQGTGTNGTRKGDTGVTQTLLNEPVRRTREESVSPQQPVLHGEERKAKRTKRTAKGIDQQIASDFEEWWSLYPQKVAKPAALKSYARAREHASAAELLEGARRYANERRDEEPKYTAHPATWLNNGRWADEPQPAGRRARDRRPNSIVEAGRSVLARLREQEAQGGPQRSVFDEMYADLTRPSAEQAPDDDVRPVIDVTADEIPDMTERQEPR